MNGDLAGSQDCPHGVTTYCSLCANAETDRWWQAFCGPMTIVQEDAIEEHLDKLIQLRANWADKSIAKAKERGRL
jgi:hypothetical protein